jgi:hypothetical protein
MVRSRCEGRKSAHIEVGDGQETGQRLQSAPSRHSLHPIQDQSIYVQINKQIR